jgi:hypothetical protein
MKQMSGMTGRDGAVDHIAKAGAAETAADQAGFAHGLGCAVIDAWSELPQPIQEQLFERAVAHGGGDAMLRERLAKYLHEHHNRTAHHR